MKLSILKIPLVLFFVLLTACSNNSKEYDAASISQLFEDAGLHLKPQAESSYPAVMNIEPHVYELLDDHLSIYVFESENDRVEALKDFDVKEFFDTPIYMYQFNNILIIYIPLSPAEVNFEKQIRDIIDAAPNVGKIESYPLTDIDAKN